MQGKDTSRHTCSLLLCCTRHIREGAKRSYDGSVHCFSSTFGTRPLSFNQMDMFPSRLCFLKRLLHYLLFLVVGDRPPRREERVASRSPSPLRFSNCMCLSCNLEHISSGHPQVAISLLSITTLVSFFFAHRNEERHVDGQNWATERARFTKILINHVRDSPSSKNPYSLGVFSSKNTFFLKFEPKMIVFKNI